MIERIHLFGIDNRLIGICTQPVQSEEKNNAPGFLLLNAGLIYRVGPYRFYVDFARLLAKNGVTAFRFDLSGIGDSMLARENSLELERVKNDIKSAMNLLEFKYGIKTFVLCGLCWGAEMSHMCALSDSRVVGVVMLDTYSYPTFKFFLKDRIYPLLKIENWSRFLVKNIKATFQKRINNKKKDQNVFYCKYPPKKTIISEINALVSRNVKLLYIYSGGVPSLYNYSNQFWDMFKGVDFKKCVDYLHIKDADHLYSRLSERKVMFDYIMAWMDRVFFLPQSIRDPRIEDRVGKVMSATNE